MSSCKNTVLFILTLFCLVSCQSKANIDVFFSPSLDCENHIIEKIDTAQKSIDIVVYAINNRNIVEALKRAQRRNVQIRILTDRLQASNKYSLVLELYQDGFDIKVHNKYKLEHNKFAIFDNQSLVTGSYNWTEPASHKNSENCLFIAKNTKSVTKYANRFEKLWKINAEAKSDKWLKNKSEKAKNR